MGLYQSNDTADSGDEGIKFNQRTRASHLCEALLKLLLYVIEAKSFCIQGYKRNLENR